MGRKTTKKRQQQSVDASSRNDIPLNADEITARLTDLLLSNSTCDSPEEATSTSEAIVEDVDLGGTTKENVVGPLASLLIDYFDQLTPEKAEEMARSVLGAVAAQEDDQSSDDDNNNDNDDDDDDDDHIDCSDDEDDDGEYIGEGECELCEREIKLTRHHLIPKSTWSTFKKKKIPAAVEALTKGQKDKARMILGGNLIDELPSEIVENPNNSLLLRRFLSKTCNICRPCHSTVHKLHSEVELAESYSTIDLLLLDEELLKFCKWASKQKAGKYSLNHR